MSTKFTFSDAEILSYGQRKGYTYRPEWSLLHDEGLEGQDDLWQAVQHDAAFGELADYVSASFMNPKQGFKVFGWTEGGFLRFRGCLPFTDDKEAGYAIIYTAGPSEGYLAYEKPSVVQEILDELAGIPQPSATITPIALAPLDLLVILGICEVLVQQRYEDGWFTASAILNAYDHGKEDVRQRILFPLSHVASDLLYHSLNHDVIKQALMAMTDAGIVVQKQVDDTVLYRLTSDYQYLPAFFAASTHMLAIYHHNDQGNIQMQFIVCHETMALCFTIDEAAGKLETASNDTVCWTTWTQPVDQTIQSDQDEVKKFCIHCGHALRPQAKFCPDCGKAA